MITVVCLYDGCMWENMCYYVSVCFCGPYLDPIHAYTYLHSHRGPSWCRFKCQFQGSEFEYTGWVFLGSQLCTWGSSQERAAGRAIQLSLLCVWARSPLHIPFSSLGVFQTSCHLYPAFWDGAGGGRLFYLVFYISQCAAKSTNDFSSGVCTHTNIYIYMSIYVCTCMHICMCIYIHMCIYICVYTYIFICLTIYMSIHGCVYMCMCVVI